MFSPTIVKKDKIIVKLNIKRDLFCKIYATDPDCMGNGTYAYMKAYNSDNYLVSKASANKLLQLDEITAKINTYLSDEGFNDGNMDKQLLYVANQHRDLHAKMKGIQEYNKLKKRVTDRLEISIPKPIIDIDDDDANVKQIDKKHAINVQYDETIV
uniref:Uncharacterized protein n=1 Tax=uncultured marine virus TaxID=186617 RepID=A0A0F7L755_9VIRU|nr:hypothetical protein ACD_19C00426G0134 [uncultured marine virus]